MLTPESELICAAHAAKSAMTLAASSTMAHNKFQLNQGVYQMLGPLKLSALAGGSSLSARGDIPTGKMPVQEMP